MPRALALRALGAPMRRSDRRRLLCALVDIVQGRRDWPAVEQHARKLLEEFPDETMAVWAIVNSHLTRGDRRAAWRVIVEHDAEPFDKDTALLFIQAYQSTAAESVGVERLLDIASEFAHDEEVAAAALMAIMFKADGTQVTEAERSRFAEGRQQSLREIRRGSNTAAVRVYDGRRHHRDDGVVDPPGIDRATPSPQPRSARPDALWTVCAIW